MSPSPEEGAESSKRAKIFRTRYLIQPKFQLLFAAILVFIALLCAVFSGFAIYLLIYMNNLTFVKYNLHTTPEFLSLLHKQGNIVVVAWIASFSVVALILFIAGIFLSHRMAGPIFAFMREMKKLKEGDLTAHLELRKKDEFKELKAPFNQWVEYLQHMTLQDIDKISKLSRDLESLIGQIQKETPAAQTEDLSHALKAIRSFLKEKETSLAGETQSSKISS
jgi:methyl-accepting chemotaxis protein